MTYADVEIRIFKQEAGGYPVEITVAGEGEPGPGYLDPTKRPASPTDIHYAGPAYGQELYDWLFAGNSLQKTWATMRGAHSLRRVRLRIDPGAAELHAVPWEALCEPPERLRPALHLAAATATPFSRYLPVDIPLGGPISRRPLRILVVAPAQVDFKEKYTDPQMALIEPEKEFQALQDALQLLVEQGVVELTLLRKPCTLAEIAAKLREGYHVLHLICHGSYGKETQRAALILADGDNKVKREKDDDIVAALAAQLSDTAVQEEDRLRLVFLASCETAKRSSADAFRGLAPKLVHAGVPAVMAMQDQVGEQTAREFAQQFYAALLRHGQVDLAANQARQIVMAARLPGPVIPVLFLRMEDGRLLEPDPDWAALSDALAKLQAGDTYADVADDRGRYLRLPVEAVPIGEDRPYQQTLLTSSDPTAGIPFVDAVREKLMEPSSRLILVVGAYGSNITTQLKRFAWLETREALDRASRTIGSILTLPESGQSTMFLPLFASLGELRKGKSIYPADPMRGLVLHKLADTWPGSTASELANVLEKCGVNLLLILDDDDTQPERERLDCYSQTIEFATRRAAPGDKVILAVRPASLEPDGPFEGQGFDVLGVQRIDRRKVRHFLQMEAQENKWAQELLDRIDQSVYFDLVAVPWFLVKLVAQARSGFLPRSRSEVISAIVDDAIDRVVRDISGREQSQYLLRPSSQGLEDNVRQVVYDLAWQMQSTYADTMPLADTLAVIEQHRGYRYYGVEPMYEALVTRKLLARKGSDGVRFAYESIQSYCCARAILRQPNSKRVLDDIVASLGRLTRLRWWEDTLVFACGLMARRSSLLNEFLRVIVYGMDPRDNEQVFLAARCIAEGTQAYRAMVGEEENQVGPELNEMANAIATALTWRLDSRYESRSAERSRAAELLGQVTYPPRVKELVQVAYGKSWWDRHNRQSFDHSDVRMAAVVGLLRLVPDDRLTLLRSFDQQGVLATMLEQWINGDVPELVATVHGASDVAAQSIAALALGDLCGRLVLSAGQEDREKASLALNALTTKFQDPTTQEDTMWAVAYALAMIDLPTVKRAMSEGGLWTGVGPAGSVAPLSDERITAFFEEWSQREAKHKFLAYLIGLARWRDLQSLAFLREQCLERNTSQVSLAAVAIDTLSRVGSPAWDVPMLEKIAVGSWDAVLGLKDITGADREYLQRKAIDSLADLGDLECVDRLRGHARTAKWGPELEKALYLTSEKIFWRLHWDRRL